MLKFYKFIAVHMLMYRSEYWAMNTADRTAAETAEMKFLRYIAGYPRKDQARNDNIRQKLTIFNLNDRIQQYKKNCYKQILLVDPRRITQQILRYKPVGHWEVGRLRRRLEDDL
jgi:hypothetical protein